MGLAGALTHLSAPQIPWPCNGFEFIISQKSNHTKFNHICGEVELQYKNKFHNISYYVDLIP